MNFAKAQKKWESDAQTLAALDKMAPWLEKLFQGGKDKELKNAEGLRKELTIALGNKDWPRARRALMALGGLNEVIRKLETAKRAKAWRELMFRFGAGRWAQAAGVLGALENAEEAQMVAQVFLSHAFRGHPKAQGESNWELEVYWPRDPMNRSAEELAVLREMWFSRAAESLMDALGEAGAGEVWEAARETIWAAAEKAGGSDFGWNRERFGGINPKAPDAGNREGWKALLEDWALRVEVGGQEERGASSKTRGRL